MRAEKAEGQEQEEAAARMPEEDPHPPQACAELPGSLGEKGNRFLPEAVAGGWLVRGPVGVEACWVGLGPTASLCWACFQVFMGGPRREGCESREHVKGFSRDQSSDDN